jgi:alpha-beta hydrolase superfamily lysophospholipase
MRGRRLIAAAMAAALIGGSGLVWAAGAIMAAPDSYPVPGPAPPGRAIGLEAADGTAIAGSFWPAARGSGPAVLLLHGINADRTSLSDHVQWLNGLGYAVLAIDSRGHGASAAVERTFGWREAQDARAAFEWLKRDGPKRKVGVIGVSLGGAAALLGEAGPIPAEAMVLHAVYPDLRTAIANRIARVAGPALSIVGEPLLSYQSWPRYGVAPERIAPLAGLRRYRGSLLIVAGGQDLSTTIEDSRRLYAAAPGPKALWVIDGADHEETSKLWTDEYRARVRSLFARTLGDPRGG